MAGLIIERNLNRVSTVLSSMCLGFEYEGRGSYLRNLFIESTRPQIAMISSLLKKISFFNELNKDMVTICILLQTSSFSRSQQ